MDQFTRLFDAANMYLWGISGGLAHLFVSGKKPNFTALVSCIFVSGFAGLMAGRLMEVSTFAPYLREVVIGMAGFGGPVTLTMLYRWMAKKTLGVSDKDIDKAQEDVAKLTTENTEKDREKSVDTK